MLEPDLLILASNDSDYYLLHLLSSCVSCEVTVSVAHYVNTAAVIEIIALKWTSTTGKYPANRGFHAHIISNHLIFFNHYIFFPPNFTFTLLKHNSRCFNWRTLKVSSCCTTQTGKTTERQQRWQMRLSSLSGLAYGNNQGKWGSAGPTVISRRPHVHVSFNSSTRPSVD